MQLWLEFDVEPLEAVYDGPAEERYVRTAGTGDSNDAKQVQHSLLIAGLDHDDRHARPENQLEIALPVHWE